MLFSPRLITLNKGVTTNLQKTLTRGQRVLVIARAQCSFRSITLKGSGRSALQAAYLRAKKEAFSQENKIRIVKNKQNQKAGVWGYEVEPNYNGRTLPESLAREGYGNGVRLIACLEGVEGQVWDAHFLTASRWWPKEPTPRQWQAFMRVAYQGEDQDLPTQPVVASVPFRTNLPVLDFEKDRVSTLLSPLNVFMGGALVFACINFYLGAQFVRHTVRLAQTEVKTAELSQSAALILSDRRKALGNMAAARRFEILGDKNSILNGLDGLAQILTGQGLVIRSAQLQGGDLEIQLNGQPDISGPTLVARLESIEALSGVTVALNARNVLVIKAKLQQENIAQPTAGQP